MSDAPATLRDQIALAALTGMLAGDPNFPSPWKYAAAAAYLAADAMLEARRQRTHGSDES